MTIKEQAKKLKSDIPAVFIALKDKDTPLLAKIIAGITVGYALSPIDLVPDFIPVLGYLDDVILLPALVALTIRLIPKEVWIRSKINAEGLWENGKPKKWYYSIPIFIIWGFIIWIIIKAIWF
ncbi:MAG: YkvA family protein [Lachnospiraceae bacterium]|nr:YkvA family protein [Lachnospiraceae bacterium]